MNRHSIGENMSTAMRFGTYMTDWRGYSERGKKEIEKAAYIRRKYIGTLFID